MPLNARYCLEFTPILVLFILPPAGGLHIALLLLDEIKEAGKRRTSGYRVTTGSLSGGDREAESSNSKIKTDSRPLFDSSLLPALGPAHGEIQRDSGGIKIG